MQEFLNHFQFLSEYSHIFSLAVLVLLIVNIFMLTSTKSGIQTQGKNMEKNNRETILAIDDNSIDTNERMARMTSDYRATAERLKKATSDELATLQTAVNTLAEMLEAIKSTDREDSDKNRALFEKQGVFLHDRFGELAASEDKRLQEVRQTIKAILTEQDKRIENIQNTLTQQASRQTENIEALRDGIASQVADLMLKERALQQEIQTQTVTLISDSINRLAGEMDAKLTLVTDKVGNRFSENLASTMQSFETLQTQIDALIAAKDEIDALGHDVTSLTRLILNKSSGGMTGGHLPDMLAAMLPDDAYILNPMVNGHAAAAQLMLPGDQGAVIVDNSLALQEFERILEPGLDDTARQAARQQFGDCLKAHINHVADNFISPPTTGQSALLFVSSETAFAEIQAHHRECVSLAANRQVWLVSPTTLAAALNMARSALRDQKARVQLEQMRHALQQVAHEAQNFEARLLEIGDHVSNAMRSVRRAENAGGKLFSDVRGIAGISNSAEPSDNPPALPDNNQKPQ